MRKISDLHKAIEKSKGKNIHLLLRGLDQTKSIFNRNYFWLLQLDKFISENIEVLDIRNRDRINDFHLEFARHLHNYLASVKSLVDHTRALKQELKLDSKFEDLYEQQRMKILGTDTITFIQQLREYVQHYKLLPSGIQVKVDNNDGETITLTLDTPALKGFSGWKGASLRVIEEHPENIDIFNLLEEYQTSVSQFYKWFYDEMEEIFKNELTEFDELAKEYKAHHEKMMDKEAKKPNTSLGDWDAPQLEERIVCISDDYILSSQISSCFSNEGTYFVVLEPPRSLHKYWENEFVKLNNVLAKIHPQKIIFINVKNEFIEPIKRQLKLSENRYEYLANQAQVTEFVDRYNTSFKGTIDCPPDREKITYALLEAKRQQYRLVIKEDAIYKMKPNSESRSHLIISDSSSNILPVTLADYAFSINADVFFFKSNISYSPIEIYSILSDTRGSDKRASIAQEIVGDIKSTIRSELEIVNKYKLATFFTDDFPYGYFFPEIPTTHIFNKLLPSQFIADSISQPSIEVQSALLVDPGFFPNSETNGIASLLSQRKVHIKELRDDTFSNLDLDYSIQFFPYDFLFICSHGSFPEGTRFKIKFVDKNGIDHIIVIDTLDEFNPTNKGSGDNRIIGVKTFYEFVELDEQPWYQKKYKKGSSKTLVEDFLALERKWNVIEKKKVSMRYCNVIVTKDTLGPYIPMIHGISDPQSAPFIFNNACVSTYTMCVNFIFAGSSFYIGTVKPVKDLVAVKTALHYFENSINQNKSLSLSLWEALNEAKIPREDRVYTCIGCHFKKFSFTNENNKNKVKERLQVDIALRLRRVFGNDLEKNVKERHTDAINFLLTEHNKI